MGIKTFLTPEVNVADITMNFCISRFAVGCTTPSTCCRTSDVVIIIIEFIALVAESIKNALFTQSLRISVSFLCHFICNLFFVQFFQLTYCESHPSQVLVVCKKRKEGNVVTKNNLPCWFWFDNVGDVFIVMSVVE